MKVNELREKLAKLKKEEVIKIASEFYKLIPKAKKEDYDLDAYINNPNKSQKKSTAKEVFTLVEVELAVTEFISNAKKQYYLIPNRVVPKKERATWRFKVKKWYKELINTRRADINLKKQSELLTNLYELMCESCCYEYFSAYDSFESIGIEQSAFYRSVIDLLHESKGKLDSVPQCIKLIINNYLNRYTLYSTLMVELISTFETVDLKYKGIEVAEALIQSNNFTPEQKNTFSSKQYQKQEKNNNLAELGLRLCFSLYETAAGIDFYHKYYYDRDNEIKLYVLIRILFGLQQKQEILDELEKAIQNGIKPRKSLLNLKSEIHQNGELPQFMR